MLGADSWVEPAIHWLDTLDISGTRTELSTDGQLLVTWPASEFDTTETDCFRLGDHIWIWQPEVGAVRFALHTPHLQAYLWPGADRAWFRQVVTRSWLPAIYPLWGRQVLHASALVYGAAGDTVAFAGATHAGKSTTAFGLRQRFGWPALCDDTLAFSLDDGQVRLHPLQNEARLRPASAGFYGVTDRPEETLEWPGGTPTLRAVYFLEGHDVFEQTGEFTRLRAAEALPLLLAQAYALSLNLPKYNQQLMKDYLSLASGVPSFRLRYRRSFDVADDLFSSIAAHLASL